ncbi:hypothetical protein N7475_006825 [Penicillium sp. IBT 31633x]|nr:hypothetical protein N7475_006825 [Penicillium sp. IBT 31633x]
MCCSTSPDHKYKFNVQMACGGCVSAVQEALNALSGVKKFEINLEEQAVFVVAEHCLSFETVLGAIKAKGKNVRSGEADGAAQTV